MAKIYQIPTPIGPSSDIYPSMRYAVFGDSLSDVTSPGYLSNAGNLDAYPIDSGDIIQAFYNYDLYTQTGDFGTFSVSVASNGVITLTQVGSGSGSGTVDAGLANQLSYYASSGTTVEGLSSVNNAVLVTNNTGAPSWKALGADQVALGRTGDAPFAATLTAGANISIVSNDLAGTVTISAVGSGGSGTVNSGTANQLSYYAATGDAVSGLATANNAVLVTNGTGVPSLSTTLPTVNIGTPSAGTLTNCTGLPLAGLSGAANSAVLVSNNAGVVSSVGALTNGQLIIGSTGGTPVASTLTAGANISITNAAGSITIASTAAGGGMTWNNVTGTSQATAVNNGYVSSNPLLTTFTLPSTAAVGDIVAIQGAGAAGWTVSLSGQTVVLNSGSASTSISSTQRYDVIYLVCIVANTTWAYNGGFGNYNLV